MDILRFKLKGKSAFFKKPEVNSCCYFSYGNIHKIALLGIFGAVIGCKGYDQIRAAEAKKKNETKIKTYPDFYEKLKDVQVAIMPCGKSRKGIIGKKVQSFNNSVGYASFEQGGNLIVREQWLESPEWEICLLLNSEAAERIKDSVVNYRCVFYPYLGKNDHFADIENISVEKIEETDENSDCFKLDCLAPKDEFLILNPFDIFDEDDLEDLGDKGKVTFKYEEALPYEMNPYLNGYILRKFIYTDAPLKKKNDVKIYRLCDDKKIVFY